MQLANEKNAQTYKKKKRIFLVGRDPEYSGYL
jgi:hypothetical protein